MFGRKSQKIRNLERLARIRTAERDEALGDLRAARYAARKTASLFAADPIPERLARALRACARYRRQAAIDRVCFDELAARYWDALGYGPETLAKLDPSYATEAAE
jgi:hypothetical protein